MRADASTALPGNLGPDEWVRWLPVALVFAGVLIAALHFNGGVDRSGLLGAWIGLMALPILLASRGAFAGWRPDWVGGAAILMLIWLFASQYWSQLRFLSNDYGYLLAALPASYLLARSVPAGIARLLVVVVRYVAIPVLVFTLFEFAVTQSRSTATFIDANVLAALINAVFFPAYAEWLGARASAVGAPRSAVLTSGFAVVALVTTTSLGGLLCFVPLFGLVTLIGLRVSRRGANVAMGLTLLLVASYVFVYSIQNGRGSPLSRIAAEARSGGHATMKQGSFLHERLAMDLAALKIAADHPLLGSGPGTFKLLYPRYRTPTDQSSAGNLAHNDYLQILAEGGPVLLACLLAFLGGFLVCTRSVVISLLRRSDHEDQPQAWMLLGVLAALAAIFGHAAANFIFYVLPMPIISGIYIAAVRSGVGRATSDASRPPPFRSRVGWLIWSAAALMMTITLVLPTFFSLVADGLCGLNICKVMAGRPSKMMTFANLLASVYPSWIAAPDYLATAFRTSAKAAKQPEERHRLNAEAAQAYLQIIRTSPAYPFAYDDLAALVADDPGVSRLFPATLPHDPLGFYRRAEALDPLDYRAVVGLVGGLAAAGDDAEAMAIVDRNNRFRDLNVVPPPEQAALLMAGLPSALRLGRCSDAQAMAEAILVIGAEPIPALAHKLADPIASSAAGGTAKATSSDVPGCGLAPQDYTLPAAVVPAPSR